MCDLYEEKMSDIKEKCKSNSQKRNRKYHERKNILNGDNSKSDIAAK